MNIKKHLPTFARWFKNEPYRLPIPQKVESIQPWPDPRPLPQLKMPAIAKETPRKRCAYIPTNESPWAVLKMRGGKWVLAFSDLYDTRKDARKDATACQIALNCKTRVVRAIIPTR